VTLPADDQKISEEFITSVETKNQRASVTLKNFQRRFSSIGKRYFPASSVSFRVAKVAGFLHIFGTRAGASLAPANDVKP